MYIINLLILTYCISFILLLQYNITNYLIIKKCYLTFTIAVLFWYLHDSDKYMS